MVDCAPTMFSVRLSLRERHVVVSDWDDGAGHSASAAAVAATTSSTVVRRADAIGKSA